MHELQRKILYQMNEPRAPMNICFISGWSTDFNVWGKVVENLPENTLVSHRSWVETLEKNPFVSKQRLTLVAGSLGGMRAI